MTDIVELLRIPKECVSTGISADVLNAAAEEIAWLRNKLADWARRSESCESKLGQLEANERVIELEQLLAESQAREAKLREALEVHARWGTGQGPKIEAAIQALALPTDDTAMKEAIKQAKREMLLEVVDCLSPCDAGEFICDELRNWAEELK